MRIAIAVYILAMFWLAACVQGASQFIPRVEINKICVVAIEPSIPRWVELRNVTNREINLDGWLLRDATQVLYRFDHRDKLASGQMLVLLFYPSTSRNSSFEELISKRSLKRVSTQIDAFGRRRRLEPTLEDLDSFAPPGDHGSWENWNKNEFGNMYERIVSIAKKRLVEAGLDSNKYLAYINWAALSVPHFDEVALFDSENTLQAYISLGAMDILPEEFEWEILALEKGLAAKPRTSFSHPKMNQISNPAATFEKIPGTTPPIYGRIFNFVVPGTIQLEEALELLGLAPDKIDEWRLYCGAFDSHYPSWLIWQFSNFDNFSEVSHILIQSSPGNRDARLNFDPLPLYQMGTKSDKTYYRTKRTLCDGHVSSWQNFGVVNWSHVCGQFAVSDVLELVEKYHELKAGGKAMPK